MGSAYESSNIQQIESITNVTPTDDGGQRLLIRADFNNQCSVDAIVSGSKSTGTHFLLDSGAGNALVFSHEYASLLGIDSTQLKYDHFYRAWGSRGSYAIVPMQFRIGNFVLNDVMAAIDQRDKADDDSLIGAPLLKKLKFQMLDKYCAITLPGGPFPQSPQRLGTPPLTRGAPALKK